MEFLRGSLFSIAPFIRMEGHQLDILVSGDLGRHGYYVDMGYRRRFWTSSTLYLVHREADETVRWEPIEVDGNLGSEKRKKGVQAGFLVKG